MKNVIKKFLIIPRSFQNQRSHLYGAVHYSATARAEIPPEFFHVSAKRIANSTVIEPSGGNNLYN